MYLERMIQQIRRDKWAALEELDKKYNVVESRMGFPPKRRYQMIFGRNPTDTLVVEREWESMAAMETVMTKALADPEYQALGVEGYDIIQSVKWELYFVLT
jgi:hypothetical protein